MDNIDKIYQKFLKKVMTYIHNEKELSEIERAYKFAYENHKNQYRTSGESYIIHPLEVCIILCDLTVGPTTLIAALLHDVVEDTAVTSEDVSRLFGDDVAQIVEGVTKVSKLKFSSLEHKQAENHQKMLLAMAKDIRVIVVKLADRLHNIRTIDVLPDDRRLRICQETLDIYAPLAHRLGMFRIKAELEDRSLKYVDPLMYKSITEQIRSNSQARMDTIDHTIEDIKNYLKPYDLPNVEIKGRIKNIYSIYKKMISQHKEFEDIYDVLAIRIIVNSVASCYQVLGIIHAHYTPVPKRFKDYIAVPKPNLYQSLHTTVIGDKGQTFEVQIRTEEMDKVAEYGVAAHWAYKENVTYSKEKEQYEIAQKLKWYAELLKFSEEDNNNSAEEFVETIKDEILTANVYVYTPTGEVIDLPKGATPLDFAYKIHTNLGNKTIGAIVNNRIVPLDYELSTGDIVTIKTNKNSFGPSDSWLKIVKTNHAKQKIKSFLNKQNKDILIASGRSLLSQEFTVNKILDYNLTDDFVKTNFSKINLSTVDDLYAEIGKGVISSKTVINKYLGVTVSSEDQLQKQIEKTSKILVAKSDTGIIVDGISNPQIKLANCCNPIPGDSIVGYVTKGNGIVVHNINCSNMKNFQKERLINVRWASHLERKYPVIIRITATQNINLITEIMNVINANGTSIASFSATNNNMMESIIKIKLLTFSLQELEKLITNMKKISFIHNIERDNL